MKNTHGGKRAGAGMPKGYKTQKTLDKEAAREVTRSLITAQLEPLISAQIANAQGLSYLVYRDKKTGKFERVKSLEDVNQDEEQIEVWEKDPSVQAFTDLMNRALDKAKDQPQEVNLSGKLTLESLITGVLPKDKA